jgi:5-hydroxyisourate hydrolase-like protein (transthyretin family)
MPEIRIPKALCVSVILALATTSACGGSTSPDENFYVPGKLIMGAVSPSVLVAKPGDEVVDLPTVAVVGSSKGVPAPDVSVVFVLKTPGGQTAGIYVTKTDTKGRARLNAWHLGSASGVYMASASADGIYSVDFRIFARGAVIARYELDPGPTSPTAMKSVVLYEDGSFYHVPFSPLSGFPTGRYEWLDQSHLRFFLDPSNRFFQPAYSVYGEAVASGSQLVMTTGDVGDGSFLRETYVRH